MQVVATPSHRSPGNFLANDKNHALQLKELFTELLSQDEGTEKREKGYPDPLRSTALGLRTEAFKGRVGVPLFVMYFLGYDLAAVRQFSVEEMKKEYEKLFKEERQSTLTRSYVFSRLTEPGPGSFPHCNEFSQTPLFFELFSLVTGVALQKGDLCQADWSSWPEKVMADIRAYKTRLILTKEPYLPTMMALRTQTRTFRYNDDFEIDGKSKEIIFKKPHGLVEGDLLEASYFLQPTPAEISGNPQPPGAPTPTKK